MNSSLLYLRLFLALSLIIVEAMILSLLVDASLLPKTGLLSILLAESGNFLRWLIVSAGLLVLFLSNSKEFKLESLLPRYSLFKVLKSFVIQFILFFLLILATYQVFVRQPEIESVFSYLWLVLVLLSGWSWCVIITGISSWRRFLSEEKSSIAGAAILGTVIVLLGFYFQQFWGSMTEFTLGSAKLFLEVFYDDILFDASQKKLGIDSFWVYVAPVCSGIEGAILAVSIAGLHLYLSRNYLKLPQALILLPIAAIISIGLNIVRIAVLIIIGEEISPLFAVGGFHSIAGWLSAVIVALLIVFVFSSWKWIQKIPEVEPSVSTVSNDSKLGEAILIPFFIFTLTTLISSIFVSDFDYYYPIKIVLTIVGIRYFWKTYQFQLPDQKILSISVGVFIAFVWIAFIPENTIINSNVNTIFDQMSYSVIVAWSIFRLVGFVIVVPILEELVFRGYILSRLSGQSIHLGDRPEFSLLALVVSATSFGLLHNAWLVGTIAGFLLAYVRYSSKSITNCIIAHSTANILVAIWAIYYGHWALF